MTDVFNKKKGYCSYPDSVLGKQYPNRKYLGEPFYHSVRYSYEFDERIQLVWLQKKMWENLSGMNIIKGMTIIRCIFFSKK